MQLICTTSHSNVVKKKKKLQERSIKVLKKENKANQPEKGKDKPKEKENDSNSN